MRIPRSLLLLLLASIASASPPLHLSVQGRLTTTSGLPLQGLVSFTSFLWTSPTTITFVHAENDSVVLSENGTFITTLGDNIPLDPDILADPLYVNFRIDGGDYTEPRLPLAAAPYAGRALVAENALQADQAAQALVAFDLQPSAVVNFGGFRIKNIGDPTEAKNATTRDYVDNAASSAVGTAIAAADTTVEGISNELSVTTATSGGVQLFSGLVANSSGTYLLGGNAQVIGGCASGLCSYVFKLTKNAVPMVSYALDIPAGAESIIPISYAMTGVQVGDTFNVEVVDAQAEVGFSVRQLHLIHIDP